MTGRCSSTSPTSTSASRRARSRAADVATAPPSRHAPFFLPSPAKPGEGRKKTTRHNGHYLLARRDGPGYSVAAGRGPPPLASTGRTPRTDRTPRTGADPLREPVGGRPRFSLPEPAMKRTSPLTLAALLLGTAAASAQRGPAPPPSPEVKPDRTVVFRLTAPKATTVQVRGEWGGGPKAMTKDDNGVWTVTVGPLEPDQYSYTFNVDGATVIDPRNTKLKIGRGSMSNLV